MSIRDFLNPPLTQQWVDMVRDGYDKKSDEIEEKQGPQAATAYRERTGKKIAKMQARVDPAATRTQD